MEDKKNRVSSATVSNKFWGEINQMNAKKPYFEYSHQDFFEKIPKILQPKEVEHQKTKPIRFRLKNSKNSTFDFNEFNINCENQRLSVISNNTQLISAQIKTASNFKLHQNFTSSNLAIPVKTNLYRINNREINSYQIENRIEQLSFKKKPIIIKNHENEIKIETKLKTDLYNPTFDKNSSKQLQFQPIKRPISTTVASTKLTNKTQTETFQTKNNKNQFFAQKVDNTQEVHVENKLNHRPYTSIVPNSKKTSNLMKNPSSYVRPPSSINGNYDVRNLFSANSQTTNPSADDICKIVICDKELFDLNEQTIFVSKLNILTEILTRPSERIGANMQISQALKLVHLYKIQQSKTGSSKVKHRDFEMPIQNSILDINVHNHMASEKGMLFYINFDQIVKTVSYSLYPDFVDDEVIKHYIQNPNILSSNGINQALKQYENRDLLINLLKEKMKGTYDPEFIVNFYHQNRSKVFLKEINNQSGIQKKQYDMSISRFYDYTKANLIPKDDLAKFKRIWVNEIVAKLLSWGLTLTDETLKEQFREVFESYLKSQREWILSYILRCPLERERLEIYYIPPKQLTSTEIISSNGGYHSKIYSSWHSLYNNSRLLLNKEEMVFNCRIIAIKNWLSHFENVPLFEIQFFSSLVKNGCSFSLNSFFKYQTFYLSYFESAVEHILKRGLLLLIEGENYLKTKESCPFGLFNLLGKDHEFFQTSNFINNLSIDQINKKEDKDLLISNASEFLCESFIVFLNILNNSEIDFNEKRQTVQKLSNLQKITDIDNDKGLDIKNRRRLYQIISFMLEEFIIKQLTDSLNAFLKFIQNIAFKSDNKNQPTFQPPFGLTLNFDQNGFYFDESLESISKNLLNYMNKLNSVFNILLDLPDHKIEYHEQITPQSQLHSTTHSAKQSKRTSKQMDVSKIDKNEFLKKSALNFCNYLDFVKVNEKQKEVAEILQEIRKVPVEDFTGMFNPEKITNRIEDLTTSISKSWLEQIQEQYRTSFKVIEIFQKYTPLLTRDSRNLISLLFNQKKNYYPQFVSMIISIFNNDGMTFNNFPKEKLNFEEINLFKERVVEINCLVRSIVVNQYFDLFRVKCHSVISKMRDSLDKISDFAKSKLLERILINAKQLFEAYTTYTCKLRSEITCSSDYAAFRMLAFEATQQKANLLQKNKDILDEMIIEIKIEVIDVNEKDLLFQIYELCKANSLFVAEIEKGSERVSLTRGEFERKLQEEKQIFQNDCDDLTSKVQVYKNLSDWRNYANNYEELKLIMNDLNILKKKYASIDQQELDLYERRFKTTGLEDLEDTVSSLLEVWQFVAESLTFVKKMFNCLVFELSYREMQEFIQQTTNKMKIFKANKIYTDMENLGNVLRDLEVEMQEFYGIEKDVEMISSSNFNSEEWKKYIQMANIDIDLSFLSLRAFISFKNEKNLLIFTQICQTTALEKTLKERFINLKESFDEINFKFEKSSDYVQISNLSLILTKVAALFDNFSNLVEESQNVELLFDLQSFGRILKFLSKVAPIIGQYQDLFKQVYEMFRNIEFSVEIESEYRMFYAVSQHFSDLIYGLKENGIEFLESTKDIFSDLKKQIAIIEVIINHKDPARFKKNDD